MVVKYITQEEYYKPPSQEVFDDIKQASIKVWETKDKRYGYVDEKVGRIKDIQNVGDNYAYMVAMFDSLNKVMLMDFIKTEEARDLIESLMFTEMTELGKMLKEDEEKSNA